MRNVDRATMFVPSFRSLAGVLIACGGLGLAGCAGMRHPEQAPPSIPVSSVVEMSHQHMKADEIIRKLHASGTVYRLTGSELAKLHDEGVPDRVLDYMQHTYIHAVRRHQALADRNRYWELGPDGYWYGGWAYGWPRAWWWWPEDDWDEE